MDGYIGLNRLPQDDIGMGCIESKVHDVPVVTHCRERKEFLKSALIHQKSLASANDSYFRSLKSVGTSLQRFMLEELMNSSSTPFTPSHILAEDDDECEAFHERSSDECSSHLHLRQDDESPHLHLSSENEDGATVSHLHSPSPSSCSCDDSLHRNDEDEACSSVTESICSEEEAHLSPRRKESRIDIEEKKPRDEGIYGSFHGFPFHSVPRRRNFPIEEICSSIASDEVIQAESENSSLAEEDEETRNRNPRFSAVESTTTKKINFQDSKNRNHRDDSSDHMNLTRSSQSLDEIMKVVKHEFDLASSYGGEVASMLGINLSSTLEKLYSLEKKLYKEVKKAAKHREDALFSEGNDNSFGSIAIWNSICKLRDEELKPRLMEFIERLRRMWMNMLQSHQKQLRTIHGELLKSTGKISIRNEANSLSVLDLEKNLLEWCSALKNWIPAQRSFALSINNWMQRSLLYKRNEDSDMNIFRICSDWPQVMEEITETLISDAILDFVRNLHHIWTMKEEEEYLRIKVDYMSKDVDKRLGSVEPTTGGFFHHGGAPSSNCMLGNLVVAEVEGRLELVDVSEMKHGLEDQKMKHREAMKTLQNAMRSSVTNGLVLVLEGLTKLSEDALKSYLRLTPQNEEVAPTGQFS